MADSGARPDVRSRELGCNGGESGSVISTDLFSWICEGPASGSGKSAPFEICSDSLPSRSSFRTADTRQAQCTHGTCRCHPDVWGLAESPGVAQTVTHRATTDARMCHTKNNAAFC